MTNLTAWIKGTALWEWGAGTSKNGITATAFLILFAFSLVALRETAQVSTAASEVATENAKQAIQLANLNLQLTYSLQLDDYSKCNSAQRTRTLTLNAFEKVFLVLDPISDPKLMEDLRLAVALGFPSETEECVKPMEPILAEIEN